MAQTMSTQVARLADAVAGVREDVAEVKATVSDIDKRMRNLERAAYIAAGALVAAGGGTALLSQMTGG